MIRPHRAAPTSTGRSEAFSDDGQVVVGGVVALVTSLPVVGGAGVDVVGVVVVVVVEEVVVDVASVDVGATESVTTVASCVVVVNCGGSVGGGSVVLTPSMVFVVAGTTMTGIGDGDVGAWVSGRTAMYSALVRTNTAVTTSVERRGCGRLIERHETRRLVAQAQRRRWQVPGQCAPEGRAPPGTVGRKGLVR